MKPTNQSDEITGELKSVEPKFFLKSKTILGLIILLLAVAQYLGVDTMKMSDEARNLLATASGILIILGIRTGDRPLRFKTKAFSEFPVAMIGMLGVGCMALLGLSSCSPTHYEVNTEPYAKEIAENPSKVIVKPEHVKPVSEFKLSNALETTPDGCLLVKTTFRDGSVGKAGYCADGRYVVQWNTPDLEGNDVEVRAVYRSHGGAYELYYWDGDMWIEYSAKSGLVIGRPPSELGKPVKVVNFKQVLPSLVNGQLSLV